MPLMPRRAYEDSRGRLSLPKFLVSEARRVQARGARGLSLLVVRFLVGPM